MMQNRDHATQPHNKHNERGFTLIESIAVIVVLAVALIPVSEILSHGFLSWFRHVEQQEVVQNARFAMDWMCREIRHGANLSITESNTKLTFTTDSDNDGDIDGDDDDIVYYPSGTQLLRKVGTGSADVLAENISSITFSGTSCITITLQATTGDETIDLVSAVRNKN